MPVRKPRKRNNAPAALLILLLVTIVVTAAIIFPRMLVGVVSGSNISVNIPLIKTKLKSSNDGQDYTVQTLYSVEMDKRARDSISNELLHDTLADITSGVDVDELMAKGGIDYLNQYVTDELNRQLSGFTDGKVYVYDLFVGENYQLTDPPPERNDVYKGLFGNMN